ncbi:MAG: hypothetical protein Q4F30_01910 [Akkermansia sp.]|nr:hypothetical protein [Akkermansia sp.]
MALLLAALSPAAKADCTIVSGNVYDNGKLTYSADASLPAYKAEGYRNDYVMCWAAAASNVIQYWQDTYYNFRDQGTDPAMGVTTGYTEPAGTDSLAVYDELLASWTESSGYVYSAYSWWMTGGRYVPYGSSLKDENSGGYYTKIFGSTQPAYASGLQDASFYSLFIDKGLKTNKSIIDSTLQKAFSTQGQAVNLSVCHNDRYYSGMHAITCWGYETDDKGNITGLIVTDSDDKQYGAIILTLKEEADGTVTIGNDRYGSWYSMYNYMLYDVSYIDTPETSHTTGKKVAERASQTSVASISDQVNQTCTLTQSATFTDSTLCIGGGTYEGTQTPAAIVFTTERDAKISVSYTADPLSPMFKVADGAMALLNGGLEVAGGGRWQAGGVVAEGQLYIHGGEVSVTNAKYIGTGGGISAKSYVEIKGGGDVNISGNQATISNTMADDWGKFSAYGGGGIGSEDSFSIKSSGQVLISNNRVEGTHVHGGGAYALERAYMNDNAGITFSGNSVSGKDVFGCGGGLAAMYIELDRNHNIEFSNNSVEVNNPGNYYYDTRLKEYIQGSHASGGALAVKFDGLSTSYLQSDGSFLYAIPSMSIQGNDSVVFHANSATAKFTDPQDSTNDTAAFARGGALFLDTMNVGENGRYGAQGSICDNREVIFTGNSATASTPVHEGVARGGAIHLAQESSLEISGENQVVRFTGNSVTADKTAQGGAIYNESALSVSGNKEVTFSGNSAQEGNDLYNAEGATAEFAWNGDVSFGSNTDGKAAVVNKGTLYLAAEAGKKIEFKDSKLDSSAGKVVLGTDKAESKSTATGVRFTQGSSAMSITNREAKAAELEKLTISYNLISGASDANPVESMLRGVDIVSNDNLCVENVGMAADVSISTGSHAITLSNVVIDLTGTAYTTQDTETGTCYIFDVRNMINCELTMANVKFDASMFDGMQVGDGDCVAVNFGDDVNISNSSNATMVRNVGETEVTISELKLKSGVVYFGAAGADTPEINVPEPATGTFSLLALAALAARRRRR